MFNGLMRAALVGALAAAVASNPQPAQAQGRGPESPDPARLSVGFGVGIADPLHSDLAFMAPAWEVTVRTGVSSHLAVETAFSEWRHTESSQVLNLTLTGPSGVIGHVDRLEQQTRRTGRAAQVNLLARGAFGRVELSGGGGVGVLGFARRFHQTLTGCTSSTGNVCHDFETSFSSSSLTGQLVGGGDVRLVERLSAFGQLRFTIPVQDAGSSDLRFVGGVRVRLW